MRAEKSQIEEQLGNPEIYTNKEKFSQLEKRYQSVSSELTSAENEYERLFEELMNAE
jgi:ATP-binding cassette subfamily F protein 3